MARRGQEYVYGNVARQLEHAPRREYIPEQQPKRAKEHKKIQKNTIMPASHAMFMGMSCMLMAVCIFGYLFLHASIVSHSENVTALQREISDLSLENDAAEGAVEETINLDEIKERAIALGMVYSTGDQVVEYISPTKDYITQYEDIPENGIITSARAATE